MALVLTRTSLLTVSLDTAPYIDVALPFQNIRNAFAMDYDPIDKTVYWSDTFHDTIQRAEINSTGKSLLYVTVQNSILCYYIDFIKTS